MGTQLLPTHYDHAPHIGNNHRQAISLGDVWNEQEEVFDIGGDSEGEEESVEKIASLNSATG